MTENASPKTLTRRMRAALSDRIRVPGRTADALARRGLIRPLDITDGPWLGGYAIELTEAGTAARDALLAPLTPGTRVRNVLTGMRGVIVRIERSAASDTVVLLWDGAQNQTCGAPAYLEIITDGQATCGQRWTAEIELCPRCGLDAAAHVNDPYGPVANSPVRGESTSPSRSPSCAMSANTKATQIERDVARWATHRQEFEALGREITGLPNPTRRQIMAALLTRLDTVQQHCPRGI